MNTLIRRTLIARRSQIKAVAGLFQERDVSSANNQRIIKSRLPDVLIPDCFMEEAVFKDLNKWENKIAVECASTGRKYTFLDIYNKSRSLANSLHKFPNLKEQDTIAIILPNVPEYPIIMLGAVQAGLKVTTINPIYTPNEIARQLQDSGAKLIFTLAELWGNVNQAICSLPNQKLSTLVVNHTQNHTPPGTINFKDLINGDHRLTFKANRKHDDVALLPYSSGTTGLPKGVEITQRNAMASLSLIDTPEINYMFDDNEIMPVILPMFHIYGMLVVMLSCLMKGGKLVTIPRFDPQIFIEVLEKHQPTILFSVPPLVLLMINHPGIKQSHLSRLKGVFSGAAPLGATDIERLSEKSCSNIDILQGYGLTETASAVSTQSKMIKNGIKKGGSGMCLRNTEIKVVSLDDSNKILGPNEPGEIVVRGPQVMKCYHNNPKETQEVLDENRWFKTGDIGYYDEDEHFFITDRLKELIKVRGFQVAPAELEEVIRDLPNVNDAAVIGIPHDLFGEVPKAFVIPKKGATIDTNQIQKYVESKVSKHKHLIGGVVIVDDIPKTPSGKILRRALREI